MSRVNIGNYSRLLSYNLRCSRIIRRQLHSASRHQVDYSGDRLTELSLSLEREQGHSVLEREDGHSVLEREDGHSFLRDHEGHSSDRLIELSLSLEREKRHSVLERKEGHSVSEREEGHSVLEREDGHSFLRDHEGHSSDRLTELSLNLEREEGHSSVGSGELSLSFERRQSEYIKLVSSSDISLALSSDLQPQLADIDSQGVEISIEQLRSKLADIERFKDFKLSLVNIDELRSQLANIDSQSVKIIKELTSQLTDIKRSLVVELLNPVSADISQPQLAVIENLNETELKLSPKNFKRLNSSGIEQLDSINIDQLNSQLTATGTSHSAPTFAERLKTTSSNFNAFNSFNFSKRSPKNVKSEVAIVSDFEPGKQNESLQVSGPKKVIYPVISTTDKHLNIKESLQVSNADIERKSPLSTLNTENLPQDSAKSTNQQQDFNFSPSNSKLLSLLTQFSSMDDKTHIIDHAKMLSSFIASKPTLALNDVERDDTIKRSDWVSSTFDELSMRSDLNQVNEFMETFLIFQKKSEENVKHSNLLWNHFEDYLLNIKVDYTRLYSDQQKSIVWNDSNLILPKLPIIKNRLNLSKALLRFEWCYIFFSKDHPSKNDLSFPGLEGPTEYFAAMKQKAKSELSNLDKIGDRYLRVEIGSLPLKKAEFMSHPRDIKTTFQTNAFLSEVAIAYNLHLGIDDRQLNEFVKTYTDGKKRPKAQLEILGDLFEAYIGVLLEEQPEVAKTFINELFTNFLKTMSRESNHNITNESASKLEEVVATNASFTEVGDSKVKIEKMKRKTIKSSSEEVANKARSFLENVIQRLKRTIPINISTPINVKKESVGRVSKGMVTSSKRSSKKVAIKTRKSEANKVSNARASVNKNSTTKGKKATAGISGIEEREAATKIIKTKSSKTTKNLVVSKKQEVLKFEPSETEQDSRAMIEYTTPNEKVENDRAKNEDGSQAKIYRPMNFHMYHEKGWAGMLGVLKYERFRSQEKYKNYVIEKYKTDESEDKSYTPLNFNSYREESWAGINLK